MSTLLVDGAPAAGPCEPFAWVPDTVAKCPECGGRLMLEQNVWETETGIPLREGMYVDCEHEPDPDDPEYHDKKHRWWQGEWQRPLDRVWNWVRLHVRVKAVSA